jgi:pilus assembly protein CpaF
MATDTAGPSAADREAARKKWEQFRTWVLEQLGERLGNEFATGTISNEQIQKSLTDLLEGSGIKLSPAQIKVLYDEVHDELLGYGPLGALLRDDSISEIMVNGPKTVYVERKGKLTLSEITFRDDDHVLKVIDRIVRPLGRTCDRKTPKVDARLPDGSRVNCIVPPCALDGPTITIRKFAKKRLEMKDLIGFGSLTPEMGRFLQACVVGKLNIVVSGGTGSGKTTLLNLLSNFIPPGERIVTIEDSAELQLVGHVVRLETKPAEPDGSAPAVHIRELVINALRMRPERIVVGECRGGECLDMLQAMNTGHDGSMTTAHANTPRDCLSRLETMVLMSGMELPLKVVKTQISKAVNIIVQASRLRDGSRKITHISEIGGMEGDVITLQDIYRFEEEGMDPITGKVIGKHKCMGNRPICFELLKASGADIDLAMFERTR